MLKSVNDYLIDHEKVTLMFKAYFPLVLINQFELINDNNIRFDPFPKKIDKYIDKKRLYLINISEMAFDPFFGPLFPTQQLALRDDGGLVLQDDKGKVKKYLGSDYVENYEDTLAELDKMKDEDKRPDIIKHFLSNIDERFAGKLTKIAPGKTMVELLFKEIKENMEILVGTAW
jgi:hypothetical protein